MIVMLENTMQFDTVIAILICYDMASWNCVLLSSIVIKSKNKQSTGRDRPVECMLRQIVTILLLLQVK